MEEGCQLDKYPTDRLPVDRESVLLRLQKRREDYIEPHTLASEV